MTGAKGCPCGGDRTCIAPRYRWQLSARFNGKHTGPYPDRLGTFHVTGPGTPGGAMLKALDSMDDRDRKTIRYLTIDRKEPL